jgi:uncharacterized membrane protein
MKIFWEIASVFLLSSVKFVFGGVPLALGLGFSFFKAVTVTSLGGFTGIVFFVFLSEKIIANLKKVKEQKKNQELHFHSTEKKIFTRKNKIIVQVKHRFGLSGIALLTPFLISIPLGCYLAVRYFKNKQQIITYMFVSILFWSIAVSSFKLFFQ